MLKNKNYFVELTELKEQRSFRQPRDCYDVKKLDPLSPSGVYKIYPVFSDIEGFLVYCDQETEGGGWTVCLYFCYFILVKNKVLYAFLVKCCYSS